MPKTTPFQRIVETVDKSATDRDNHYTRLNLTACALAANTLTANGFKLWFFYAKNKEGYQAPSGPAYAAEYGLKRSSYYDCFNELEKMGYLRKDPARKNYYYFSDMPQAEVIVEKVPSIRDEDYTF